MSTRAATFPWVRTPAALASSAFLVGCTAPVAPRPPLASPPRIGVVTPEHAPVFFGGSMSTPAPMCCVGIDDCIVKATDPSGFETIVPLHPWNDDWDYPHTEDPIRPRVNSCVWGALRKLGPEVIPAMVPLLDHDAAAVRNFATDMLLSFLRSPPGPAVAWPFANDAYPPGAVTRLLHAFELDPRGAGGALLASTAHPDAVEPIARYATRVLSDRAAPLEDITWAAELLEVSRQRAVLYRSFERSFADLRKLPPSTIPVPGPTMPEFLPTDPTTRRVDRLLYALSMFWLDLDAPLEAEVARLLDDRSALTLRLTRNLLFLGGKDRPLPIVLRMLRESPEHQRDAAQRIGWMGAPAATAAVPDLVRLLPSGAWDAREKIAWALGELGDPVAIDPLTRALPGGNYLLTSAAASALGKFGSAARSAVPALREVATRHWSEVARRAAGAAVGLISGESAPIGSPTPCEQPTALLREPLSFLRDDVNDGPACGMNFPTEDRGGSSIERGGACLMQTGTSSRSEIWGRVGVRAKPHRIWTDRTVWPRGFLAPRPGSRKFTVLLGHEYRQPDGPYYVVAGRVVTLEWQVGGTWNVQEVVELPGDVDGHAIDADGKLVVLVHRRGRERGEVEKAAYLVQADGQLRAVCRPTEEPWL